MDGNLTQNLKKYFPLIGKYTAHISVQYRGIGHTYCDNISCYMFLWSRNDTKPIVWSCSKVSAQNMLQGDNLHFTGHIQIAQVPGRNEPDSAGELKYQYLFSLLESMGYTEYIGCEYKPLGKIPMSFRNCRPIGYCMHYMIWFHIFSI